MLFSFDDPSPNTNVLSSSMNTLSLDSTVPLMCTENNDMHAWIDDKYTILKQMMTKANENQFYTHLYYTCIKQSEVL